MSRQHRPPAGLRQYTWSMEQDADAELDLPDTDYPGHYLIFQEVGAQARVYIYRQPMSIVCGSSVHFSCNSKSIKSVRDTNENFISS